MSWPFIRCPNAVKMSVTRISGTPRRQPCRARRGQMGQTARCAGDESVAWQASSIPAGDQLFEDFEHRGALLLAARLEAARQRILRHLNGSSCSPMCCSPDARPLRELQPQRLVMVGDGGEHRADVVDRDVRAQPQDQRDAPPAPVGNPVRGRSQVRGPADARPGERVPGQTARGVARISAPVNAATVGLSYRSCGVSSRPWCDADIATLIATSESPPMSKKLAFRSTVATPRHCVQIRVSVASSGDRPPAPPARQPVAAAGQLGAMTPPAPAALAPSAAPNGLCSTQCRSRAKRYPAATPGAARHRRSAATSRRPPWRTRPRPSRNASRSLRLCAWWRISRTARCRSDHRMPHRRAVGVPPGPTSTNTWLGRPAARRARRRTGRWPGSGGPRSPGWSPPPRSARCRSGSTTAESAAPQVIRDRNPVNPQHRIHQPRVERMGRPDPVRDNARLGQPRLECPMPSRCPPRRSRPGR